MSKQKKRKTSNQPSTFLDKKKLRLILISAIALILIIIFVSGRRGTIRLIRDINQKQTLEQQIEELELTKAELDSIKKRLENDPTYIEKIAREEYNMKKEGEKVIKIESDSK